jgi:hypothetical protein
LKISTCPAYFEAIANHPKVFAAIAMRGQQRVEFGAAWPSLLGLEFEGGGWLLQQHMVGYYEVHTLFLPKTRNVREKAKEAMRHVFCATDALELVTRIPADLPHALALAKAMGFTERFTRKAAWPREDGDVDVTYLGLTVDEWARNSDEMRTLGEQVHAQIDAVDPVQHADDPIHDAYVGLGAACGMAGQPEKGAWLYNRWAVFAGYQPVVMDDGAACFDGVAITATDKGLNVGEQGCPQPQ